MKIKAAIAVLLLLFITMPLVSASGVGEDDARQTLAVSGTSAQGCVLYCIDTGEVVYGSNEHLKLPMASTTKIMTAIVVLENTDIDNIISVPDAAVGVEGSSAYLMKGERISVKDLLYALMLESANDAAAALAVSTCGDIESFVSLMNNKAEELGMKDTHFVNPHGLDREEHYSTAYDMALLCDYAMSNAGFAEITGTYRYDTEKRLFINHNRLLKSYEGTIGGKTGYTKRSGRCLVSVARRNGVTMCAVTLNDPDDWRDHKNLYDAAFDAYECRSFDGARYEIPVINGYSDKVTAVSDDVSVVVNKESADSITVTVCHDRFLYAPVKKGDRVGYIIYSNGERELIRTELRADKDINKIKKKTFLEKLFSFIIRD